MYATSDAYKAAIVTSHVAVSKAEIWSGNLRLATLPISGGSVSVQAKSAARRTCSVTLTVAAGDPLIATSGFDDLTPYGNELRLYRGVRFTDGTEELVPLGVFVIRSVSYAHSGKGVDISVSGVDRSAKVSQNRWLTPYQIASGSTLAAGVTAILQDRYPGVTLSVAQSTPTIQQQILGEGNSNDPWKDAVDLSEKAGYDLYFDPDGVATLKPLPDKDAANPAAYYVEGDQATIVSLTREDSTEETYNGIIYVVEGSQIDVPLRLEAWDDDPNSPTYRYGNFGRKPYFVSQSAVTDSTSADKAVKALYSQYFGAQQSIKWSAIVDPALDANDVVYVQNTGTGVSQVLIIDSLDIPLVASSPMSATARTLRTATAKPNVSGVLV